MAGKRAIWSALLFVLGTLLAIDLAGVSLAGASPGQPIGGLDVTLVKKPAGCDIVSIPDPEQPDEMDIRSFSWPTRDAEPGADANTISQAAGILLINDFGILSVDVVYPAGSALPGSVPSFGASVTNAATAAAFEALEPAGPGRSWHGVSIPLTLLPGPANVDLIFHVKALRHASASDLEQALVAGKIGVASADGTGGNFDPYQTLIFTPDLLGAKRLPALSGAGLACMALLLLAGGALVLRRRRRAAAL